MKKRKKKKADVLSIGLLVTSLYDQYQNIIWAGVQHQASMQGARVLCFAGNLLDDRDILDTSRNTFYDLAHANNVDALIVLAGTLAKNAGTEKLIQFLNKHTDVPIVCIGIEVPNYVSVIIDNEVGIRNLVSHLIEAHGCKRMAFVKGPETNDEANARYTAYVQSLTDHNLPFDPDLVCPGNFEVDSGPNAVRRLVDEKKVSFDALVCADDMTALNALKPLRGKGFNIPGEVKITGFDDIEYSQSSSPPLTTVRQPLFELGRAGVKKIFDLIEGTDVPQTQTLPTHLMVRDSCGCSSHEIFKSLSKDKKSTRSKKKYYDSMSASILSKLEDTYGFDFSQSESDELTSKLKHFLKIIIKSQTSTPAEKEMCDHLEDIVSTFFNKGLTVSLWQGILSCIFEELSRQAVSKKEQSILNSLWNKSHLTLYQVESYLQSQKRINLELENEMIQWVGDLLITCFNLEEIKNILIQYLPALNIQECYFSFYEEERTKSNFIYASGEIDKRVKQETVFPAKDLIPGGLKKSLDMSYCIMPLESEHEEFGFILFKLSDLRGQKYDTLADKIASAVNGAMLVEKIKQQNITLRKSEEDLRITLNSIGDAVIATDDKGKITRMNPMAEELFTQDISKVQGRSLMSIFSKADEKYRKELKRSINKIMRKGQAVGIPGHIILKAKSDIARQINYSGAPIRAADGSTVGVVLIFRDVTEQYQMEEQLRQSQKMEAIGQLAGGVAHDFNNMLAGITGYTELIATKIGNNEQLQKFTDVILHAAENAADLTQKLLAFSRKAKIQSTGVNVHTCIMDAVEILKHSIDRRININRELKADVSTVIGDPSQIQNVLLNLGLNARDAMLQGGKLTLATANVDLNEEYCRTSSFDIHPGLYVEVSIRDTGTGMSKEIQERIFDPFFTTKGVGKGTGLGLAAVYGIVSDHHGAINVYSELKKGTVFKVYLPTEESAIVSEKSKEREIRTGSGCILIIDDESIIRNLLESQLSEFGYNIVLAKDGKEGVEVYKKQHKNIDLVILDMVMPQMSGRDAFKAIKEINPDVKVLLMSGFSRDTHMEELLEEGALGFIQKPFRRVELSRVLYRALNIQEMSIT